MCTLRCNFLNALSNVLQSLKCTRMHLTNTLWPLEDWIVHQCTSNHKNQALMAPTCINASSHTRNTLNQLKSSASSHIRNALSQLKSSALQIKCAQIHLNDSNQDLQCWNVHTCTSSASKHLQRTPIKNLCTSKLQMACKTSKLLQSSWKVL